MKLYFYDIVNSSYERIIEDTVWQAMSEAERDKLPSDGPLVPYRALREAREHVAALLKHADCEMPRAMAPAARAREWLKGVSSHEWQPIETAPTDGASVLVAYPDSHGGASVTVAHYALGVGRHNWDYINSHCGSPKYWMPLPAPPADGVFHGPTCDCDGCSERYGEFPE